MAKKKKNSENNNDLLQFSSFFPRLRQAFPRSHSGENLQLVSSFPKTVLQKLCKRHNRRYIMETKRHIRPIPKHEGPVEGTVCNRYFRTWWSFWAGRLKVEGKLNIMTSLSLGKVERMGSNDKTGEFRACVS